VSGTGDAWFTAPAPVVDGLFFPGYGAADAAPDLGDSAITETAGVGGFAMAASPAIVQFVGGTPQDAIANTNEMAHITLGRNGALTLPAIDFAGTPAGIDARKVVDTGSRRSSTPASRIARRASARSAPASPAPRSPASPARSSRWPSASRSSGAESGRAPSFPSSRDHAALSRHREIAQRS
jgi:hypothetical protein